MSEPTRPIRRPTLLLLVVLLGTLLGPLDSAVNISFPDITSHFAIELAEIRWVVIAYVATYASLMLVFGRVGDLFGHQRIFAGGLVLCIAGFALCSLAPTYNWLLIARILQGVGTAMVLSCGPALATHLFAEDLRPRILGTYAMMFGLGGALGPSLGGLLVDIWGWSAVFWFRLPLAAIALVLMIVLGMPAPPRDQSRFDLRGAVLLAVASGLLLVTFSQIQTIGERPQLLAVLLASSIAGMTAFIMITARSSDPVIHLPAFRNLSFTWINVTNVIVNVTGFATMLFVPYFLVRVSELPLWQGGLVLAVGPLGMTLAASLAGRWISQLGASRLALIGSAHVAAGLLWIGCWQADTGPAAMAGGLIVHGAGLGLFQVASLESVIATLPKSNRGVAGALTLVMRTVGVVIAASTLPVLFSRFERANIDPQSLWPMAPTGSGPEQQAFQIAFYLVFVLSAAALAAHTIASLFLTRLWKRGSIDDDANA